MRLFLRLVVILVALTPFAVHAQDGSADTSSLPSAEGTASTDTDEEAEAVASLVESRWNNEGQSGFNIRPILSLVRSQREKPPEEVLKALDGGQLKFDSGRCRI